MGAACVGWAHGPLGFARVVSITTEANLASRRVMAKLGFTFLTRFATRSSASSSGCTGWMHR